MYERFKRSCSYRIYGNGIYACSSIDIIILLEGNYNNIIISEHLGKFKREVQWDLRNRTHLFSYFLK